jgi:hypothetical protein
MAYSVVSGHQYVRPHAVTAVRLNIRRKEQPMELIMKIKVNFIAVLLHDLLGYEIVSSLLYCIFLTNRVFRG